MSNIVRIPDEESLEKITSKLIECIKDLQFGSVTLHIQNGRVIQIDKLEKTRLKKD
ncbi:hypothetical protein SAMN02745823_01779 [Sporobacter termitidis DSM 10068]|uniref:DUF2292 domain-containing protein n=1 Tax=Sporobacter termitidis DSM 10068 TaxID=1123282 RepID=A0A1M5XFS0_9FIRM|nr:YezD family protein [Sporobacter termitidis]SHH98641.1 hypothetical protein SAMN02745823_01779 [Sporobacter termitidis DSM 10068]